MALGRILATVECAYGLRVNKRVLIAERLQLHAGSACAEVRQAITVAGRSPALSRPRPCRDPGLVETMSSRKKLRLGRTHVNLLAP